VSSAFKSIKSVWDSILRGLVWVGEKMSIVVTPIFLTLFYFIVIGIAGIAAKLVRADLLHRRPVGNPTFWFPKQKERLDESRYRAQY
jgi:hypothetical protein